MYVALFDELIGIELNSQKSTCFIDLSTNETEQLASTHCIYNHNFPRMRMGCPDSPEYQIPSVWNVLMYYSKQCSEPILKFCCVWKK